jgi:hypothetical protein
MSPVDNRGGWSSADPRALRGRMAAERRTLDRPAAGVRRGLCVRDAHRERHGEDASEAGRALRRPSECLARGHFPGVFAAAAPLESLPEPHPVQAVVGDVEARPRQHLRAPGAGRTRRRVAQYILDPTKVTPLVTSDGSVYYQLNTDNLSGITGAEHRRPGERDRARPDELPVPSAGRHSPLYACGLAAAQGLSIQNQSRTFFGNGARPSGVLTAPGAITPETAKRLKDQVGTRTSPETIPARSRFSAMVWNTSR